MKLYLDYTNYEGKRAIREVLPDTVTWKSTLWHPEPQWLLHAFDYDKKQHRDFALKDVHRFSAEPIDPLTVRYLLQAHTRARISSHLAEITHHANNVPRTSQLAVDCADLIVNLANEARSLLP